MEGSVQTLIKCVGSPSVPSNTFGSSRCFIVCDVPSAQVKVALYATASKVLPSGCVGHHKLDPPLLLAMCKPRAPLCAMECSVPRWPTHPFEGSSTDAAYDPRDTLMIGVCRGRRVIWL